MVSRTCSKRAIPYQLVSLPSVSSCSFDLPPWTSRYRFYRWYAWINRNQMCPSFHQKYFTSRIYKILLHSFCLQPVQAKISPIVPLMINKRRLFHFRIGVTETCIRSHRRISRYIRRLCSWLQFLLQKHIKQVVQVYVRQYRRYQVTMPRSFSLS